MDMNEYQKEALVTKKVWADRRDDIVDCALGIAGECGETIDIIKKFAAGAIEMNGENTLKLKKEIGDILWYVASLCDWLGCGMDEIARLNIEKLRARHGAKFSGFGNRVGAGL
jgi:NTP pyrophosphatase (non-canonical NTP hydrolase)